MTVTPDMDRHNARIYALSYMLIYFAAPVVYVGVVQAALCDKLGASSTVANLPASAYFFGFFAPVVLAWLLPYRFEKRAVVGANVITSSSLALVSISLFLPFDDFFRLLAVIGQGLVLGFSDSISIVYMYQCLNRGTTLEGRASALKWTYTFGPPFAVAGSLAAQFMLGGGLSVLRYPGDFAALYLVGALCMAGVAILAGQYKLVEVSEQRRESLLQFLRETTKSFWRSRTLAFLWLGYFLFYSTLNAMPNLSLFVKEALGREPKDFSGIIMALRFGFKSIAGFLLGVILARWGPRAPMITTVLLVGAAIVWAWIVPGYFYLLAFGLMGAGELAGAYFPNYIIGFSSPATGARNLSFLTLVLPVSSVAPALHGGLTDLYGFPASFAFAIITSVLALWLVLKLPAKSQTNPVQN